MSRLIKLFFVFLVGLFFSGMLLISQTACSQPQQAAARNLLGEVSTRVDDTLETPSDLVFAGQIANEAGAWQNEYVVVLFKNGEELTRTTSRLLNSPLSGKGPMDGVFELRVSNVYELSVNHTFYDDANNQLQMSTVPGLMGTRYIGRWLGELNPSDIRVFHVGEKQLTYSVVVLPVALAALSDAYQPGRLRLNERTLLTDQTDEAANGAVVFMATAVPQPMPAPESNIQLVRLPSQNNGQDWHLQLTGYYGNRWDVWERFVAGYGHSMSWETFKEAVLVHNPHLESDGFVFYPNKLYLLPATP
ncbi:MAG: hypothetical protein IPM53_04890 [Anaerolineaceae bacterium]|nr:hypothetical protein [Anaerolineaceae bacterium]